MAYTFEILGVSTVLDFFDHQQSRRCDSDCQGVDYLGAYHCTLDSILESTHILTTPERGWDLDRLMDTIVQFWIRHPDTISLWKRRLSDAGQDSLLVARVGTVKGLRQEFETLMKRRLW